MEKVWQPIAAAPAHAELELSIYHKGEYHALAFPCQRDGSGWRDVRANRSVLLEPTHWRLWDRDALTENRISQRPSGTEFQTKALPNGKRSLPCGGHRRG